MFNSIPSLYVLDAHNTCHPSFQKICIEFVTILFMFWFFWPGDMWDLNSQPGMEPLPPALRRRCPNQKKKLKEMLYQFQDVLGDFIYLILFSEKNYGGYILSLL